MDIAFDWTRLVEDRKPRMALGGRGQSVPDDRHFSDPPSQRYITFPCRLSIDREGWSSPEGHTAMGIGQTVDQSPDGQIVRPGPARPALPDVMAEAPQP